MTSLRGWILILALTSAAAGAGGGFLLATWLHPRVDPAPSGAFPDYEELMARTFRLSDARREVLRIVLESYRADVERIKDGRMADYMVSIEPDLRRVGDTYRDMIRDRVLPESQRADFDRLALALPANHAQH